MGRYHRSILPGVSCLQRQKQAKAFEATKQYCIQWHYLKPSTSDSSISQQALVKQHEVTRRPGAPQGYFLRGKSRDTVAGHHSGHRRSSVWRDPLTSRSMSLAKDGKTGRDYESGSFIKRGLPGYRSDAQIRIPAYAPRVSPWETP